VKNIIKIDLAKVREQVKFYGQRLRWWLLSPSIFIKVLGISLLMLVLLGSVSLYQIRKGMLRTHYLIQGENVLSLATSISGRLDPLILAGDTASLDVEINRTMGEFPDVRYIIVQDAHGKILSHGLTFPKKVPEDLLRNAGDLCAACHAPLTPKPVPADILELQMQAQLSSGQMSSYTRHGFMILEVKVTVGAGPSGFVRLGVSNEIIAREVRSLTQSLAVMLFLCMVLGLLLAFGLAYVLVHPIRDLLYATQQVRQGDFSTRAKVYSHDEIGHLAETFNQMTEGLEAYQRTVKEKETARQMLLKKIVQAQEEERKHVARELHDQLGQMLSKTLMTLDSSCGKCEGAHTHCPEIRSDIRAMIDEVRQLAWNVRPSILDDYGLNRALERYIKEMAKRVNFSLDYEGVVPEGMEHVAPMEVETTVYRIVQEAITNIMRHANATEASVVLISRKDEVVVIVEDNGQGFSVNTQMERQTLGLMGMRERAALVGGSLTIDSETGKGVAIRVRIPIA
jgi:signal transduction histidine kinase